jgi:predicted aconitase
MLGDSVAWGEPNAVIYANSVLGARTLKNLNMFEALIALTGRAPRVGVYLDENRLAELWVHVEPVDGADDSFWPILGYTTGAIASARVPVITGLETLKPTTADYEAFSATFATTSSAAMFHMFNLTPEAPTLEAVSRDGIPPKKIDVSCKELYYCWDEFNHGSEPRKVDLIFLGNPHFSFHEIKELASLFRGKTKHTDIVVMVTCGRTVHSLASQAGYVGELEKFGVRFLTDTCWCSIEEPVIPKSVRVIKTNLGKYIHYGPGLTSRQFCFGSMEMCAEAAITGSSNGEPPAWLRLTK